MRAINRPTGTQSAARKPNSQSERESFEFIRVQLCSRSVWLVFNSFFQMRILDGEKLPSFSRDFSSGIPSPAPMGKHHARLENSQPICVDISIYRWLIHEKEWQLNIQSPANHIHSYTSIRFKNP